MSGSDLPQAKPAKPPLRYRVIEALTTERLAEKVERLAEKGWQPQGGIAVTFGPTGEPRYFYQAMCR